jgi:TPR repeat protein
MLRRSVSLIVAGFSAFAIGAAGSIPPVTALDEKPAVSEGRSPAQAFREGAQAYRAGDKTRAVRSLEQAAEGGHALALWKLAEIYAQGDGVARDDAKAFRLFQRLASEHAETSPQGRYARIVSGAFLALGNYYVSGVKDGVRPDARRAVELFRHAATYFGDAEAQYSLGRIYLDGTLGSSSPKQAVRWLVLAAKKDHSGAQALLGSLLWQGRGVEKRPERGLAWLAIAKAQADAGAQNWIAALSEDAFSQASQEQKEAALKHAEEWRKSRTAAGS